MEPATLNQTLPREGKIPPAAGKAAFPKQCNPITVEAVPFDYRSHFSTWPKSRAGLAVVHYFARGEGREFRPFISWENPPGEGVEMTPGRAEQLAHQLLAAVAQARSDKPDRRCNHQVRYGRLYRPVSDPLSATQVSSPKSQVSA